MTFPICRSIPNLVLMAPKNKDEMEDMMRFAVDYDGPVAMRYPRGEAFDGLKDHRPPVEAWQKREYPGGRRRGHSLRGQHDG